MHVSLTSVFIQQIQQPILDAQCRIHYIQFIYSNCAVYSTFVTISDGGSQLAKSWKPHFREKLRQQPCTVKPACNGTARDQTFFRREKVLFSTGILRSSCLLSFGAESFVFQVAIQKFKDQDIYNYNLVCCFVWVSNLVADIARGKEAEGV